MTLYAGLMSGTSMDGIDVALLDVETQRLVHGFTKPYSADLKNRLLTLTSGQAVHLSTIGEVNTLIGQEFAAAILDMMSQARVSPKDVKAIGSHGQTVAHDAFNAIPYTIQLGCAHTIAKKTGIPVVSDFRTRDIVSGGQGAPFAPLYHNTVFAHLIEEGLAIVNIGGIANITVLSPEKTQGWDIGPGNCLMDAWIHQHQGFALDKNGNWALQGQIDESLLHHLQQDPFFQKNGPKSIGKEYFSLQWLQQFLPAIYKPEDIQATLLALTAWCITQAAGNVSRLIICGGGAHNTALLARLKKQLRIQVQTSDEVGIASDYIEAMMFAWLASKAMQSEAVDLRCITGSEEPVLLGVIYPVD